MMQAAGPAPADAAALSVLDTASMDGWGDAQLVLGLAYLVRAQRPPLGPLRLASYADRDRAVAVATVWVSLGTASHKTLPRHGGT